MVTQTAPARQQFPVFPPIVFPVAREQGNSFAAGNFLPTCRDYTAMRFVKMQGVGNDFVVVDGDALPAHADPPTLARAFCERRFGVGSDGLLVLTRGTGAHALHFQMFNPDGSEDMCGNGLRCAGLYAFRAGWLNGQTSFTVSTKDGPRTLQLLSVNDENTDAVLSVEMGRPLFAPAAVPVLAPELSRGELLPVQIGGETYPVLPVNTGSTHSVIFTSERGVDDETFFRVSPLIENHPLFPQRTSVLWTTVTLANAVQVRIWERGAGETLGCGTGACAVAVACRERGLVGDGPIDVISKGGILTIDWPGGDADITMTGPAARVFAGEL